MNIEAEAIAALRKAGIDAYAVVPQERPEEFATVQSLGGSSSDGGWTAAAGVAVDFWAATRYRASELALAGKAALWSLEEHPDVLGVFIGTPFPSVSEDGIARYEVDADFKITNR